MTNYATGHYAEKVAADYLKSQGFEIVDLNWKTKQCEIDIVAKKKKSIYFVEVKSRRLTSQGNGLEYITPKKLKQMSYAAEVWVADNDWHGEAQLAAIEITGEAFKVTNFVTDLCL